jgi:hypothetical protein
MPMKRRDFCKATLLGGAMAAVKNVMTARPV